MPWEFEGENLVYKQPPETAGYTWTNTSSQGADSSPSGQWVQNEGFDPTTLLNGRVDKYGRLDLTPKEGLNTAEKRAYDLAYGGVDPNQEQFEVKSIDPNFVKNDIKQWWNVDPAYQNWWVTEHNTNKGGALGTGGGLIGMRPNEYIVPAAILAGGALAAYAAPAAGALGAVGEGGAAIGAAGEGALTTGEILGSSGFTPVGGASFAIEPGAAYTTGALGGGAAGGGGGTGAFTDASLGYTGAAQELGLEGSASGATDLSGTQGSAMLDSMGLNTSGISASDIATNANRAKNIAKMLSQGSNSGLAGSLGQLAQGQTGVASAIPALLRGNQNPFIQTAQQPIRNAQPMDLSSLANLLKQG
jgi:hypothetical protein